MRRFFAWTLTWTAALALPLQLPSSPARAEAPMVTIEECKNLDDSNVRDRIRELAATNLKAELTNIDFAALIDTHWTKANVSARIDREIDDAVAAVRADSSWFDRAYSTVSQSSAARYATAVADKAYNSDGFKATLDELATGVARDAGAQIMNATAQVSNPVLACVQTALQSQYGTAIAEVFAQESQKNLETAGEAGHVKIETSDIVINNARSISGIVLIVTRRVIARIVQSVGRRVAGLVASRIVSSVVGLIGLALIAKDLYEAGEGAFPIIAERMKSEETKNLIKDEIGKTIQADIGQQVNSIAQETADRIYAVWLDFKKKYERLLALAEKNAGFSAFLKDRQFEQLSRLGQIVDIVVGSEGEDRIFARVADGSLNRALGSMGDEALTIAAEKKSLDVGLKWAEAAGRDLPRVVDLGLYRMLEPDSLSQANLKKLLSLNDKIAIARVASLDPPSRDFILALPSDQMRDFARRLNDQQLAAFVEYQRKLEPAVARRLLRATAENPRIMQELSGEGLRRAILDSRNQGAALDIIISDEITLFSYPRILRDAKLVHTGDVGFRVFWERYWPQTLLVLFILILFLSWMRRLIFGYGPPRKSW